MIHFGINNNNFIKLKSPMSKFFVFSLIWLNLTKDMLQINLANSNFYRNLGEILKYGV